mgnify:CR=1 FL=1
MSTYQLDITRDHCPMTFVKTKLKLDQLHTGDVLEVLLNDGEPLENVPLSVTEQGHTVLDVVPVEGRVHRVNIQKGAG